MKPCVKIFSFLSASTLLGCAQPSLAPAPAQLSAAGPQLTALPRVQPIERISSPVSQVEELFIRGRSAQAAGQWALAEERYLQVLGRQPLHLGALNAIAVVYAQTERNDKAIEYFRRALELDPKASHVHNNLGYALLLAGRLDESEAELKLARELSPSNWQTGQNLELLARTQERVVTGPQLVEVGRNVYELRDRPGAAVPQAQASAQAKAPVKAQAKVPEPVQAILPQKAEARTPTKVQEPVQAKAPVKVQPKVQALAQESMPQKTQVKVQTKVQDPVQARSVVQVKETVSSPSLQGVRIEVSNGVGIRYLARRTADRLAPTGVVTARLTNQLPYQQSKTEIQFGNGQKSAALALSGSFPVAVKTVASNALVRNIQLRLVLGHDLVGRAIVAWLESGSETRIALSVDDGWRWS